MNVDRAVLTALCLGVAFRVAQYAAGTSLWHDEAFVALNATQKNFAELLGPLDWNEPSPPGFLAAEKLTIRALGRSEYTFRLLPLVAGLAGTVGFAFLARRFLGDGLAWLWAVLLLAASEKLIVQSNETKHFTLDLALSVAVTALALQARRGLRPLHLSLWGACAAAGVWFSYATLFVFVGSSIALGPGVLRSGDSRARRAYFLGNILALLSFALLLGPLGAQRTDVVLGFWKGGFPLQGELLLLPFRLARSFLGFFNYFWQPLGVVVAVLVFLGIRSELRDGRRLETAVLWLPVAVALAAAFGRYWPFGGNQHMVFAAPAVCIAAASGLEGLRLRLATWRPAVAHLAVAAFFVPALGEAVWRVASPRLRHEVKPVIEFVQARRRPADQFVVFCPAEWELYTGAAAPPPNAADPSRRVWLVGTRRGDQPLGDNVLLSALRQKREELASIERHGAAAYLFGAEREP